MNIEFPQILFQIINFGLVAFVLTKFLYKPILKILEQRSLKVEEGMKAAEKNLKAQADLDKTVDAELKKARLEAKRILADAKKDAENRATDIVAKAKVDAKKALETERQAILSSLENEKKQVHESLAELVTEVTRQVLAGGLSEKSQHDLIDAQIKSVAKLKVS